MRHLIAFYCFIALITPLFSQIPDLTLLPEDTYIEKRDGETGLHLFIRKKDDINSILLTESTQDPDKERSVFALRDFDENPTVKDEIRYLNGTKLDQSYNFLIDSTPEPNEIFGEAFHIYIPRGVSYGYPWSREGQIDMGEGSWLNIRTFPLEYGVYDQGFMDNPFIIRLYEEVTVIEPPAESIFEEIARETNGDYSEEFDGDGAVTRIGEILDKYKGQDVDLALVVDTTISMKDDVEFIRQKLIPLVKNKIEGFKSVRIGVVLYRDYKEAYLTKKFDFVDNFDKIQAILDSVKVQGGRDIPEAVFEALYDAESNMMWENSAKIIVQVGDAPPHPEPRGDITSQMVYELSREKNIEIYPILLQDEKRTESEKREE
ncbi:MAG: VWA domain-containing protein [Spirochaetales bacterium]|nr:VWA domain-containing protein [Spirochaetales bacterium]